MGALSIEESELGVLEDAAAALFALVLVGAAMLLASARRWMAASGAGRLSKMIPCCTEYPLDLCIRDARLAASAAWVKQESSARKMRVMVPRKVSCRW